MAEAAASSSTDEGQIEFFVKSSSDAKYTIKVPAVTTVADLKTKLSSSEYADIPTDRIRLIYSGRVLKDPDTLGGVNIKDGHTIHLVKGAASNARQNPANQGGELAPAQTSGSPAPAAAHVPTNIAAGTGNGPLAGLTGARYAGMHGLPGADMFGPDGGMGPPQDPESLLRMMENPMFLTQMNEAMNNPAVIQMMQDSPMLRNNPIARQMLQNPEFRRMLMNPEVIRMQLQMQRNMGGAGAGGAGAFPAPGLTNTTPGQQDTGTPGTTGDAATGTTGATSPPANPLAMFGDPNAAGGAAGGNPFAALFGGAGAGAGAGADPFAGTPLAAGQLGAAQTPAQGGANADQANHFATLMQQMMQNQGGAPGGAPGGANADGAANPFANMFNMFGAPDQQPQQQQPVDNRPPEDRYADQLRQLNDMGFYDFDRNITALRRSGGSVQGAVDFLLNG